jgi:flavin reductase (DIM6/NTAB) family NADH-FMN oxidoreductase RutF
MPAPIAHRRFRQVLSHVPTGVVAITASTGDGQAVGLLAGSFTSVSLDPPLVSFCAMRTSRAWQVIKAECTRFGVSVLAADQEHLGPLFSRPPEQRFDGIDWAERDGLPLLTGAVAWLSCGLHSVQEAGDHDLVLGVVHDLAELRGDADPMIFVRGGYPKLRRASA